MTTKRRQLLSLVWLIALVASGLAQQPQQTTSVNRLRQAVEYLASDALEGRRTGTPGANGAAHYIAGEFSLLGLQPGMNIARPARTRGENRSRYLQSFPYVASVALGKNNELTVITRGVSDVPNGVLRQTLRVGEHWVPLGFSTNMTVVSEAIVPAGFGISAPELNYNDYALSQVKNGVAVVLAGTPDGDNPHSRFAQAGSVRFKVAAARAAGAGALIIISSEKNLNEDRLAQLSYDNAGEAGLPVIVVSRTAGALLLGGDEAFSAFEKAAVARTGTLPVHKGVRLTVDVVRRESPSSNIIGILPGSDPKLKDEAIVIGAHYDHLGRGGAGSLAPREGEIHHGADDNASGTAALIELARRLSTQRPKPRRTIVFIAFSGEEEGLLGSNYYVNHPVVPLQKTIAMINMDMIGRLRDQKLMIGGIGTAPEWRAMVEGQNSPENMATAAANEALNGNNPQPAFANLKVNLDPKLTPVGYPVVIGANGRPVVIADVNTPKEAAKPFTLTLNEDGYGPSDHSSFYSKQIPVLFFFTGSHNDYHKPSDTSDKINYEGEAKIVSFVERIIRDLDKSDKRPTYAVAKSEPQGRTGGFRVYLGTIPNYADSSDGLLLDGVRDASPAAKAGMKAGDKIVKIAGHDVKNVYDYTFALGEMKGGQEYEIEVVRGTERLKLKITPEARK
jgi:Peptidase family M28/PDZ domain/PA domain